MNKVPTIHSPVRPSLNSDLLYTSGMTFGNLMTENGEMKFYLGEGRFTEDEVPANFFGCAGVAEIPQLQDALIEIGGRGHRHHTAVTPSQVAAPVKEAFEKYLGYEVTSV